MKVSNVFFLPFLAFLIFNSCQQEDNIDQSLSRNLLTIEHIEFLEALGINLEGAAIEKMKDIDGIYRDYIVSHDLEIPVNEFNVWKKDKNSGDTAKQYRSRYIVAPAYRNITVVADGNLSANQKEALKLAINEYNLLDISLKMTLKNEGRGDIKVYSSHFISSSEAVAGFPNWIGRPYNRIRTGRNLTNYSIDYLKGIFIHELGHCVGLRHQDFKTRSSCIGSADPEGEFIAYIEGTPVSDIEPSIMLACMRTANGSRVLDFTPSDIEALKTLY